MDQDRIARRLNLFVQGGGTIEVVPPGECRARDWNQVMEVIPEGAAAQRGRFMIFASGEQARKHRGRAGLVVARNRDGKIIGGAMVQEKAEMILERLGSDRSQAGTGTALLIGALLCASNKELGLVAYPIWESGAFWKALGATQNGQHWEWGGEGREILLGLGKATGLIATNLGLEM